MGFCSDNERFLQARREYAKIQRDKPPFMAAFYEEQRWRTAGEETIKAEMERRLDVHYIKKHRKRA